MGFKDKLAGFMMAYGGIVGVAGHAMANDDVESLDETVTATTQADAKLSPMQKFKLEQQQKMSKFKLDVASGSEKAMEDTSESIKVMNETGASKVQIDTETKDGITEKTVTHNGGPDITKEGDVATSVEDEKHQKRIEWLEMNDKVGEHGVTAHSINTDIREAMAAAECGIPISEDNLMNTLTIEEVANLHKHMANLDPAHTLDATVLYKLTQAECTNEKVTSEIAYQIQIKLEVDQGKDFAAENGLDEVQVNSDYEAIER